MQAWLGCQRGVSLAGWVSFWVLLGCSSRAGASERAVSRALGQITYAATFSIPLVSSRVMEHPHPSLINKIIIATLVTFSFPKERAGSFT